MKWLSLLKVRSMLLADIDTQGAPSGAAYASASRYARSDNEYDRYEDEGSSSMFTIIGPLRQLAKAADQAVSQAVNDAVGPAKEPRIDAAPVAQNSPVKKMKLFFDDTANYDASESLNFR